MPPPLPPLPIEPAIPEILQRLEAGNSLVLEAPPGAGKTTRVPLALLDQPWLQGRRILVLEPRRLAARAAARRMAALRGEAVGGTVGYRVRLDSRVGPDTRIEVVTDGILIRQLQDDPGLEGVGAILFDEFHERGLESDLGLALMLDIQRALRPDLRLVIMSATLDGARVASLLGDAPVVRSEGRSFPVETRYLAPRTGERFEQGVARAIRQALAEEEGSLLVFLPGAGEIRRVERLLGDMELGPDILIAPLYGDLSAETQDRALLPALPGQRKIVLATAIAETSLTIEDVRIVVDGGVMRVPRFDPRTGMTRLETIRVSRASADQRRGRAGRTVPGTCYRLWSEEENRALVAYTAPEILSADLVPLALELACWGTQPGRLPWMDPPPDAAYRQACDLLGQLGALDEAGQPTTHGRAMAGFGLHPRLAHMLLTGAARGQGGLACDIAALLSGRDVLRGSGPARDADLRTRLELMRERSSASEAGIDRGALAEAHRQASEWRRRIRAAPGDASSSAAGPLVAEAYPDRIAQRRSGALGEFLLANGRGVTLAADDPLAGESYLAVAEIGGDRQTARIFLAAPLARAEIETWFADRIETREEVAWSGREEAVSAVRQRRLGALALQSEPLPNPSSEAVSAALLIGLRQAGLERLPWTQEARGLRARLAFLRRVGAIDADWPDLSDEALLARLEDWLVPALSGFSRLAQLDRLDLTALLRARLSYQQQRSLDELAPSHVTVPSGSRLPIDYEGDVPSLSVRVQEMFGARQTPAIAGGRAALRLHLLSPAHRPLQVTDDIAGFWKTSYPSVRKEMHGRYPKHPWPEDPTTALPTNRVKPRTPSG